MTSHTITSDLSLTGTPRGQQRTASNWARARRLLLQTAAVVVGVVATAAAAGAVYEAIASTGDTAYPMVGRMVDVGGYRLHLDCRGDGTPTVVLDSGLGKSSLDWVLVQSELAGTTRVCSYDRAGMGWSEPGPMPRSPQALGEELHTLLRNARVPGPYVLVGHSLAGKNVRLYAAAHPDEVKGMVLVDTRSERIDALTSAEENNGFFAALKGQGTMYAVARKLGLARLIGASLVDQKLVPDAVAGKMALLETQPSAIEEATAEGMARAADDAALTATTLGTMPLVVIAAGASVSDTPHWLEAQQALAALSSNGRLVVAEGSRHAVQMDQPEVVLDAIREVVAGVRAAR